MGAYTISHFLKQTLLCFFNNMTEKPKEKCGSKENCTLKKLQNLKYIHRCDFFISCYYTSRSALLLTVLNNKHNAAQILGSGKHLMLFCKEGQSHCHQSNSSFYQKPTVGRCW